MADLVNRIPPNNLEAERAVLGSCFIEPNVFLFVTETLTADDFYDPRHRKIFEVMMEYAEKALPCDEITISNELNKRGIFEDIGGRSMMASLSDQVVTTASIEHHCAIVKEKSVHRSLIRVGSEIAKLGYGEDLSTQEALASAEQQVYQIAGEGTSTRFTHLSSVLVSTFEGIERGLKEKTVNIGVNTGFADFDNLTGGLQPGSLTIIAARPSMGKTAFALNIAQNVAVNQSIPVLIFSLEMSSEQLATRLLSAEAEVNIRALQQNRLVDTRTWNSLTGAVAKLSRAPIFIDDSSMLSTLDLRSRCRRFFAKHREQKSLVVVDYLQLMSGPRKAENRQQEVSDISRALKGVAREFKTPVIALSQLSREVEKRGADKRPMLSDLRDSGAIEQDADLVAFLYRPAYYEQDKENADPSAEVAIAKHRNGPTGKVDLIFHKEYSRFIGMVQKWGAGSNGG